LGLKIFLNFLFHPQTKWMKIKSRRKTGLKLAQGTTMFLGEKEFFLPKDMIPNEKKV
jgi:hypothetical protein